MDDVLDIAVGVLVAADGRLLIAKRRSGTPGAGCWEFPGGKQEPGEAMIDCLARELGEEIGVGDIKANPLIRFTHDRGQRPVRLHVWRIDDWSGEALGREGQQLAWVERARLGDYELLPATDVILNALFLPERYVITPSHAAAESVRWWGALSACLEGGAKLLRLRDQQLDDAAYGALAAQVIDQAKPFGAQVLVDRGADLCERAGAAGLHWPIARLLAEGRRPFDGERLLAVSAHTPTDLASAARLHVDFAMLSPVSATPTHPGVPGLGWDRWAQIRADHALPVYALGGLGAADIATAQNHNAQGVAAIRAFWG